MTNNDSAQIFEYILNWVNPDYPEELSYYEAHAKLSGLSHDNWVRLSRILLENGLLQTTYKQQLDSQYPNHEVYFEED